MCFYSCVKNKCNLLITPTLLAAAMALGASKTNAAGQEVQSFRKDIVQVGKWVHPGTGENVEITLARIQHWADTGNAMIAAGIKIPIPATHSDDPEDNRGYVQKFDVEGDKLFMNCELIGKDAIQLAGRCEVSISVVPEMKGADGKVYRDPVKHVALVTDPVIPGQGQFQIIELSRAKALQLSIGASPMEHLKKIAADLGIEVTAEMDEAALAAAIQAKIGTLKGGDMAKTEKELEAAKTALSRANEQVKALELSAKKPELDADTAALMVENANLKLSKLVEDEKISPAVRTKLETNLGIKGDKPAAIMLSATAGKAAGFSGAVLNLVLDALNELPAKSSKSGIKFSRDGDGNSKTSENAKKLMASSGRNKHKK